MPMRREEAQNVLETREKMHMVHGLISASLRSNDGCSFLVLLRTLTGKGQGMELSTGLFTQGSASQGSKFRLHPIF